jgi:hypothetical protein
MMQHVDPWIFSSTSSTMHRPMAQGIALQKKLLMRLLHLEEVAHALASP